jgi:anaphase-promoting complex subunit 5
MILLADVGLEFGLTKRSKQIIENILPQVSRVIISQILGARFLNDVQVITGDDLEQRALACVTYARCAIAAGERSSESLRDAIAYLKIAEQDYAKIECLRPLADVHYLLSVVYHNLDMKEERNAAAERNTQVEEELKREAVIVCEKWVEEVWQLNCEIGAALAMR